MKTILYNPIFINPQAYYVFPRLTRYLQPDNESTAEPANYIGTIEVKVIAYGDTTLKRTYTNTDSIDLSEFKNTWIRISLFTKVGSCVLGEWKIGNMESDLPYIDPEVLASLKAVVIVGNKTNNDSDRAIVKNLVDPSNPFIISNAAFKLNSGFGKYEDDFTNWVAETGTKLTSDKITNSNPTKNWIAYRSSGVEFKEMHIRILGIPDNGVLYFQRPAADGGPIRMFNGDNNIPAFTSTGICGFFINNLTGLGWSNLVIEQIPSFQGAFVTDGIDDLITSTKTAQEMGITDEVTVVSMIHQIDKPSNFITTNNIRTSGSVVGRNAISLTDKTGIYGWYKDNIQGSTINVINNILGDKADYTASASSNTNLSSKFSVVGYISNDSIVETSQVAWYWTIIANKVLTTDQINQVIAYFNLDRTLKPDILCNTIKQGITNENHAEFGDKLIDFSGNGRDIQLNNIAWKGDSGIGKYEVDFSTWSNKPTETFHSKSILEAGNVLRTKSAASSMKVKVQFDKEAIGLSFRYFEGGVSKFIYINSNGEYSLPPLEEVGVNEWEGFSNNSSSNVTITQIPSHAGALCLDGINDFGKATGMPIYKDYTFIIDREIISIGDTAGVVASKSEDSTDVNKQGAFLFEYLGAPNNISTWSFYKDNGKVANTDFTRGISYQSTYSYNGKDLTIGTSKDSDKLWLGTIRDRDSRFFNGAIYSLMSFPYSMSEFLIERQLKKHKLGTLYPNMVEFRPIIKSNVNYQDIIFRNTSTGENLIVGQYYNLELISIYVKPLYYEEVSTIKVNNINAEFNSYDKNTGYYRFDCIVTKSPQKINLTIEQDENYVLFNPIIKSNVEYHKLDFYLNNFEKRINIGDYIPKDVYIRANFYLKNNVDELTVFTFNGVNIDYRRSIVDDTAFNIGSIYNYDSPQEVNITIDEYIRYENIKQPYPVLLRFNDENGNEVSWGGKFRVGSTITRIGSIDDPESNLLNGLYSISGLSLNGKPVTRSTSIVEKQMVFRTTATWLLDNNEPKVILSPSRLRIPNSSYKLLGYIPDISGHGNHGKINNSAYAEGSGVNEDGSYQFDGVDDFVTIPTLSSGGKQVLMKVNLPRLNEIIYDQRKETNTYTFAILTTPSQIAYDQRNSERITYIDGILNTNIIAEQLMGVTHNIVVINSKANLDNTRSPILGRDINGNNWSRMRIYDFMLFDNISTDDKIKQLNEYVGIEAKVELPPYYWDAYGKTNLDADKATIQQRGVAVGDYDLTNTNFAYDKMSGFGGYEFEKFTDATKWIETKREDGIEVIEKNDYSFTAKKVGTGQYFWDFKNNSIKTLDRDLTVKAISNNNVYIRWEFKYRTAEKPDIDSAIILLRQAMTPNVPITVTLPYKTQEEQTELGVVEGSAYYLFYFDPSDIPVGDEYTVEMLPLYTNGLVYDGITDYSKNANIPALDDFTAIIKREWLKKQGCPLIKGSKVYEGGNGNALLLEWDKAYNFVFYKRTDIMEGELPDNISFITPTNYNGNVITRGSEQDTNGICIAGDGNAGFANMVFYKLILYPKTIPLLQINFLKNLMERDEIIDLNNKIFIQE